jgi:serine/threonine protein kinase
MAWSAGKKLNKDKYTVQELLGEGRFGITYLASDRDGNLVVIKTPRDVGFNLFELKRLQELFVQEAHKLAQCHHPHIVSVKELFQEGNLRCIAMEYIDGTTLDKRSRKILPEEEALQYINQIGQALIVVHGHRLLHRDLRPGNIMIRAGRPEAVLIDFGLALDFDHELTKTRTEELSAGFAPIECYSRKAERGAYTDIYGLGATLYNLLTGTVPISAIERKIERKPLVAPKSLNPAISNRTNEAILSAMELEANKRPRSVQDWFKSLGLSGTEEGRLSRVLSRVQFGFKDWVLFWTSVGAIATVLSLIVTLWNNHHSAPPNLNPSPQQSPVPKSK